MELGTVVQSFGKFHYMLNIYQNFVIFRHANNNNKGVYTGCCSFGKRRKLVIRVVEFTGGQS